MLVDITQHAMLADDRIAFPGETIVGWISFLEPDAQRGKIYEGLSLSGGLMTDDLDLIPWEEIIRAVFFNEYTIWSQWALKREHSRAMMGFIPPLPSLVRS